MNDDGCSNEYCVTCGQQSAYHDDGECAAVERARRAALLVMSQEVRRVKQAQENQPG